MNATQSFLLLATAATLAPFALVSVSSAASPPLMIKSTSVSSVSKNRSYAALISPAVYA